MRGPMKLCATALPAPATPGARPEHTISNYVNASMQDRPGLLGGLPGPRMESSEERVGILEAEEVRNLCTREPGLRNDGSDLRGRRSTTSRPSTQCW